MVVFLQKFLRLLFSYFFLAVAIQAKVGLAQPTNIVSLIEVKNIDFKGNTIFSSEELRERV